MQKWRAAGRKAAQRRRMEPQNGGRVEVKEKVMG